MREEIEKSIYEHKRLSDEQSLWLLGDADIWDLARWAHYARCRDNSPERVTYQIDLNINYTNECVLGCRFCAFYRSPDDPDGYVLSIPEILAKVKDTLAIGGTGILLQGGCNPDLPFKYYTELLKAIRARYPTIHIHAFSPPEIIAFSKFYSQPIQNIIGRLIEAGLDSVPGGGAEILSDSVRNRISPKKCTADEWIQVMRICHQMGLKTTSTMVIGFGETNVERLEHLLRIRDLQDETNGFTAFILWTFQSANTNLSEKFEPVGAYEYLRMLAASRLILDNVPHHQVSWITQGLKVGSIALYFGADDISSVMPEENVVSSAGLVYKSDENEIREVIESSGFKPVKRLTLYQNILHG